MGLAVVFAGRNGLDQVGVRTNVVRIPEVSMRIREAQTIIETLNSGSALGGLDLLSYIMSEDPVFMRNQKLKALCAAIVQVGLFDRLKKSNIKTEVLIGAKGLDSALDVVSGRISFTEMVKQATALTAQTTSKAESTLALVAVPLLAGVSLDEYEAVASNVTVMIDIDAKKLLKSMIQTENIKHVISIGPIPLLSIDEQEELGLIVEDSIHREPMLAWFWSDVAPKSLAG